MSQRPNKRLKLTPLQDSVTDASLETEIQPHSLNIKPSGNALTSRSNLRDTSTGLFAIIPDELILQVLGHLDSEDVNSIGAASKGMYGFSRSEELWKTLFIESPASDAPFIWRGTWRRTVLKIDKFQESQISLQNLFSDALYRPYHMSQIPLDPYVTNIPLKNQILRFDDLSDAEFDSKYSNTPFILTAPVKLWLGYKEWTYASLVNKYGDVKFQAESVEWRLRDYVDYMENQTDESPLYLFDRAFVEKTNGDIKAGFTVPACFGKDFFEVLSDDRPDHRWMILGPKRSGSTFHKDPNATSAWNAVIQGKKYWVMFPPDSQPPGVFVSADQAEVTSPLSVAEWLFGFHRIARASPGCVEGICAAGEILYIPSGWWHLVVNINPSLALTQNFVPKTQLPCVLKFLLSQPHSVSGFNCTKVSDPYSLFVDRMREKFPQELEAAQEILAMQQKKNKFPVNVNNKWDELVKSSREATTHGKKKPFSFGFVFDEEVSDDK